MCFPAYVRYTIPKGGLVLCYTYEEEAVVLASLETIGEMIDAIYTSGRRSVQASMF